MYSLLEMRLARVQVRRPYHVRRPRQYTSTQPSRTTRVHPLYPGFSVTPGKNGIYVLGLMVM